MKKPPRGYRIQVTIIAVAGEPLAQPLEQQLGLFSSVEMPADAEGRMSAGCAKLYSDIVTLVSDRAVAVRYPVSQADGVAV